MQIELKPNPKIFRPNPYRLVKKLLQYDVISFDIFDTLLFRPFIKPTDLFLTLTPHYNIPNFSTERINAEKRIRRIRYLNEGHHEVNIYDIYNELSRTVDIDIEQGVDLELEKEKKYCYPNPYMKRIFDMLVENQKKIILISDMYYPESLMKGLLKYNGYRDFEKIYVSCDYNFSKASGKLFKIAQNDFEKGVKFIHIGDNKKADIDGAKKTNWDTEFYPASRAIAQNNLRNLNFSSIFKSFYNGIVENYFLNGIPRDYPYNTKKYYYGFVHGGPLVLGFVRFIHDHAVEMKLDKILFLSRDGFILKKVYDALFSDIPSEYLLWSRHTAIKTNIPQNVHLYIDNFIRSNYEFGSNESVSNLFKRLGLLSLTKKFKDYEINLTDKIGDKLVFDKVEQLVIDNTTYLRELSDIYSNNYKPYFKKKLNNSEKIGIVDIGWRGSGILSIIELIQNRWGLNCEVIGFLGGGYPQRHDFDTSLINTKNIFTYMFSDILNKDLTMEHQKKLRIMNRSVEIFTSAPFPSFLFFDQDSNGEILPKFSKVESENKETIELIHKGEIDFIYEYLRHSHGQDKLFHISGRDAYLPLLHLTDKHCFKEFKSTFSKFTFPRYTAGVYNKNKTLIETFGDTCRRVKV
jgi:HAD superfamily hydrolase (TIGR01549 family)